LCDITVDDPCSLSDVLAPINHAELVRINLAEI